MSFNFHTGNLGRPRHPIPGDANFEIQDWHIGIGRQRNGCGTPYEISHRISDLHFGIAGETPQDGVDQAFADVFFNSVYKGRSTLVSIVPKITARWRQMEFCIFCAKSRQNERSSAVCSLNVNKLSRIFFMIFFW